MSTENSLAISADQLDSIGRIKHRPDTDDDRDRDPLDVTLRVTEIHWPTGVEHLPLAPLAVKITWTRDEGDDPLPMSLPRRYSRVILLNVVGDVILDSGPVDVSDW